MLVLNELTAKNYTSLMPYFSSQQHRLCYYSLSSLIVWKSPVSTPVWAVYEDALIIGMRFKKEPAKNYLLLPLLKENEISPDRLPKICHETQISRFQFIPGDYIEKYRDEGLAQNFTITEEPEYADYIYSQSSLANLTGKKYAKKRNLINQFKTNFVSKKEIQLAPIQQENVEDCLELLTAWAKTKNDFPEQSKNLNAELSATENALRQVDRLGFKSLMLTIDKKVKAFGIGSSLTSEIGGFHFEKADPTLKGLYQFFDQKCAQHLFPDKLQINKECDMGDPGLRQAKRSYYPEEMVTSYRLDPS